MKKSDWQKLAGTSADPARAKHFLDLLAATGAGPQLEKFSADQIQVVVELLSGSQTLGNLLVANPGWLSALDIEQLKFPRRAEGFRHEIESGLKPKLDARDYAGALAELRRVKQREMLRIAARDLARLSNVVEITREISDLADACLDAVWRICRQQFTERFGQPFHQDADGNWQRTEFCVLGMGKLGGQELNYSSDVDVLFLYGEEGEVFKESPAMKKAQRATMSNRQFFNKLAEAFIAEVSRVTPDGMLFRVDMRLRPEGDAGPLCRSLESYENYYTEWGQTWERMMLIKARGVAGDESLAAEFLEMIQPFRFPPSLSADVLREVAAVKDRIEKEVVGEEELERNVKLGRGGIREIEFIAQSLQILHAGKLPFLQTAQTLPCLAKLAQYKLLAEEEAQQLAAAYRFLRDVEHRLQMEENQQTHTIPTDRQAQLRLARLMGFKSWPEFDAARQRHTGEVRRVYDKILRSDAPKSTHAVLPPEFDNAETEWENLLAAHSFRDPETAFRLLKEFAEGPGYVHVSPHTTELARQLILKFLALCPQKKSTVHRPPSTVSSPSAMLSDPDRVVTRLDSYLEAYGSHAALLEMWHGNPQAFELMLLLFDRSEFLAEAAIRTPDLIDDFVAGGRLRQRKMAPEILKDLRHGLEDEDQFIWLRRYHEAELMRLGLRDILGLADFEQNLAELSALADACLQYALEVVMRKNKIKTPPFVVIGLGKLGGCEIDYGSDLDLLFVTDAKAKELPKLQRLAVEVKELLSRRTEQGMVFHTDARLRPDGEKGLLVNTLAAYEEYYRQRAQLWEIQALTRTRPVAGNLALGEKFQGMVARLTDFSKVAQASRLPKMKSKQSRRDACATLPLCYTPDWKKQIHQMRLRVEKERTPRGQDDLAIKTGRGGLMDAEFIAQALCLENGWQEANTLHALERARDTGVLPDAEKLLENYRKLRRIEGILRRWSYEGETVLPDDPAPYYRVSVRCGFASPEEFRKALAKWRRAIREVYRKVFDAKPPGRREENRVRKSCG
ncbi:MAG: bifunctional [glutamate--ammonia ligase]-adenylyl-L-tyrosine phosphorylase/[glutamate--ammonia-ligase] adenylyltransferase [Verrucomicrobiota bacterium]|jgi:glutamate-ammonia-ligase adenylyltransferase